MSEDLSVHIKFFFGFCIGKGLIDDIISQLRGEVIMIQIIIFVLMDGFLWIMD